MAKGMDAPENAMKLQLFSQGLPNEAIEEWLGYYETATGKGENPEAASDYAWEQLKKKWRKADNGKWVKLEHSEWAVDLIGQTSPIIEVFRAGDYPQGTITIEDLDVMVQSYDVSMFKAPVTIDHVQSGPAYGWVRTIFRQGEQLFAVLQDLSDIFKDLVKKGKYKNRSIEIFELEYKGKRIWPYFKAVSFLGAKAPQVKGMAEPVFMCSGAGCYSMDVDDIIGFPIDITEDSIRIRQRNQGDFQPDSFRTIALPGVKGIKAVIGKLKGETSTTIQTYIFDKKAWTVDKAKVWVKEHGGKTNMEDLKSLYDNGGILTMEITQEQLDAKLKEASEKAATSAVSKFKEDQDLDAKEKKYQDLDAKNEQLKKDLLDKEKVNATQFALSQFDHLVSQGKIYPAEKQFFMSMMEILSPDKAEIEFSSDIKGVPAKAFVEFFNKMKPRVDLSERTAEDPNKEDKPSSKKKPTQYANASEISLKWQKFLDENMPAALKEAGDPEKGTSEYKRVFSAVFSQAKEEITE